jgi:hypothetical protein
MKKCVFLILMIAGLFPTYAWNTTGRSNCSGYPYKTYYKGNISSDELPKKVKEYLKKHYTDHTIMISKKKDNGNYFVKIRYKGRGSRPYYRSLVFDYEGNIIKG